MLLCEVKRQQPQPQLLLFSQPQPQPLPQPQLFPPQPKRMMIRMMIQREPLQPLQNIVLPFLRALIFQAPAARTGSGGMCGSDFSSLVPSYAKYAAGATAGKRKSQGLSPRRRKAPLPMLRRQNGDQYVRRY